MISEIEIGGAERATGSAEAQVGFVIILDTARGVLLEPDKLRGVSVECMLMGRSKIAR